MLRWYSLGSLDNGSGHGIFVLSQESQRRMGNGRIACCSLILSVDIHRVTVGQCARLKVIVIINWERPLPGRGVAPRLACTEQSTSQNKLSRYTRVNGVLNAF